MPDDPRSPGSDAAGDAPLRVLIVDDEPIAVAAALQALDGAPGVEIIGTAGDVEAALAAVRAQAPDLILLDVEMPGPNGLDLARRLGGTGPEIVYVTAFQDYAVGAFEVEAVDYVVKPFTPDRLRAAIHRARRRRRRDAIAPPVTEGPPGQGRTYEDWVWAPCRGGQVRVPVNSIEWVEAAGDYVVVHTATQSHLMRSTLNAFAKRLDPARFLRVHRSSVVRLDTVREINRAGNGRISLVLESGSVTPVGDLYQARVEAELIRP